MDQERKMILEMLALGKINAEEADQLLTALAIGEEKAMVPEMA